MAKLSGITATSLTWQEGSAPSTPASTKWVLYAKTDGLYYKDDAGVETGPLAAATALGTWTGYTPTLTASSSNPTLGSTTISGRYKLLDSKTGIVTVQIQITTGGAWNAGTGRWIVSLPSGWTAGSTRQAGTAWVLDSGTGYYAGSCRISNGATTIAPIIIADSTGNRELGASNPITWATGDEVGISAVIELA